MANDTIQDPQELLQLVLDTATRHGATAADALFVKGRSTEVSVRLGEVEGVKRSRDKGVGVRIFIGDASATTSTSDLDRGRLETLIARTCDAARVTAADPSAGLPAAELFADEPAREGELQLFDESLLHFDVERAIALATEAEDIAQQADPRITNSEGGDMSWGLSELHFANSLGVYRTRRTGSASLWTTPVADDVGGGMERDYWWTSARFLEDLASAESVGKEAARRTIRRLGARKPETCQVPVVFEFPVASRLLGSLGGALLGGAIYRKASFLADKLGERVANELITIEDNPHIPRAPGSRGFDGEGLATRPLTVVDQGILKSYALDAYTARKLGLVSTRHASRGLTSTPSPSWTNFWMGNGEVPLEAVIGGVSDGLLVTEVFGFGVNAVTGDYSQGAVGQWIRNGKVDGAVHEFTVASTLQEIWGSIDLLANDRDPTRSTSAPSFRVAKMTVAGA